MKIWVVFRSGEGPLPPGLKMGTGASGMSSMGRRRASSAVRYVPVLVLTRTGLRMCASNGRGW